jgi:hypothetical protein
VAQGVNPRGFEKKKRRGLHKEKKGQLINSHHCPAPGALEVTHEASFALWDPENKPPADTGSQPRRPSGQCAGSFSPQCLVWPELKVWCARHEHLQGLSATWKVFGGFFRGTGI